MPGKSRLIKVEPADTHNMSTVDDMVHSEDPDGARSGVSMADHLLALRKKGYPSETQAYSEHSNTEKTGVVNKGFVNDVESKQEKVNKQDNQLADKQKHQQTAPTANKQTNILKSKQIVGK